jgi:uncharacterized membrane protein
MNRAATEPAPDAGDTRDAGGAPGAPEPPAAPTPATPASPALKRLKRTVVATLLALVVLALAWELWLAPTGARTLALKALPLALALPGVLRHRLYTYRWLSLLVWLYVLEGLLRATTEHGVSMLLAVLELLLALVLFTVATVYIRRRLRHAPERADR